MSSYSEYLGRMKQRLPKVQDTRPHRDAGHQTEIVKRLAASTVQDSKTPASSCVLVLNGPSTQVQSRYSKAHTVQDPAVYAEYTAGQAVAQSSTPANAKPSQIQPVCYSSTVVPELNDRLAADTELSLIQAAKNQFQRGWNTASCCAVCGEPPSGASSCACRLTVDQLRQFPTSGSRPRVMS
jgi:hypothetical protein